MQPFSRELLTLSSEKNSCNWLPSKWSTLSVFTQLVTIICRSCSRSPVPWNFKYADHFCPSWCEVWQKKLKVNRINNLYVLLTLICFSCLFTLFTLRCRSYPNTFSFDSECKIDSMITAWNQFQLLTSISPAAAMYFCDTSWHSSPINKALWFLLMALLIVTLWKINIENKICN